MAVSVLMLNYPWLPRSASVPPRRHNDQIMTIKLKVLSGLTFSIENRSVFVLTQVKLAEKLQSVGDNLLDGST